MSPVVIADSDDDDDSSYSPPLPRPTRPSFAVDTSGSTDSAFFRSVLDEQSEAARNCVKGSNLERDVESFEAKGTMSTDPLQGRAEDNARGQKADDPWEIPSSPANRPSSTAKSSTKKDSTKTPKRTLRKPTAPVAAETTSHENDHEEQRSHKRRKLELAPIGTQDSDNVDLVQLPSTQDADTDADALAPPTMPPPTLPVEKTTGVVGNALTDSQKKEYQSFAATGGSELSQDQGPTGDALPVARSSSSATNANTPRSDPRSSRNMHIIYEQETPVKEGAAESAGHWGSSPDEISAIEPTPIVSRARTRKTQLNEKMRHELDHGDTANEHKDLHACYTNDDEESDFTEEPAVQKPQKRRGRPKKTLENEPDKRSETPDGGEHKDFNNGYSVLVEEPIAQKPKKHRGRPKKTSAVPEPADAGKPTTPTAAQAAEGRSATKGKRKRGRPKKAEPSVEEVVRDEVDNDTRVDINGAKTEGNGHAQGEGVTHEHHQGPENDTKASILRDEDVQEPRLTFKAEKEPMAPTHKGAAEVEQADQTTSRSKAEPTVFSASLSASKPIHRVGLSKRSRIAPLLKIRK